MMRLKTRGPWNWQLALVAATLSIVFAWRPADADLYELSSDFSNSANPNSVWSFTHGSLLLDHYAQPSDGNSLNLAAANGFWGVGPSFNSNVPFLLQTTVDGSATSDFSDEDFLLGDVIAHSSNAPAELFINWTAPTAGTLTYSGSIWYAHSFVSRSNEFEVQLNQIDVLHSGSVTNGQGRSNTVTFTSDGTFDVQGGDVLSISPFKSDGETFGSLAGVEFAVEFTAIPEPNLAGCVALGLLIFGGVRWRQRRHTA